jgi:outer membrane murein-binding lipoprotein Lpp
MRSLLAVLLASAITLGCSDHARIGKLEKQVHELQAEAASQGSSIEKFDLQGKCSAAARQWFNENWRADKDTVLLNFNNHYNKKQNMCFILVENHFNSRLAGPGGESWTNDVSIWDVQENLRYADFSENHYTYYKPKLTTHDEVITCKVQGRDCKSNDEFDQLSASLMND